MMAGRLLQFQFLLQLTQQCQISNLRKRNRLVRAHRRFARLDGELERLVGGAAVEAE